MDGPNAQGACLTVLVPVLSSESEGGSAGARAPELAMEPFPAFDEANSRSTADAERRAEDELELVRVLVVRCAVAVAVRGAVVVHDDAVAFREC